MFDGLSGLEVLDLRDNPGSPFVLTMKLEQTGPDTFVVKVAKGAPFAMTTGLTVEGGTLPVGVTSVTVPAGSTTSEAITVAPTIGSTTPVEVSLGTAPSLPADQASRSPWAVRSSCEHRWTLMNRPLNLRLRK